MNDRKPTYRELELQVQQLRTEVSRHAPTEKGACEAVLQYQCIFASAVDSIFIVDPDTGSFIDCSDKGAQRLGYSKEEFLQLKVFDVNPVELHPDIRERFKKQLAGESIVFETIHRRKDGHEIPVEISSTLFEVKGKKKILAFCRDISERKKREAEREQLVTELQRALDEIKTLQGILPICASCKKIRDDKGYWEQIEIYIREHAGVEFTHGICPECSKKLYPHFDK